MEESNMLTVLKNLERMFCAFRFCLNEDASKAVLFGMAIEAQTLALKLNTMFARWNRYLPFHEVIDVNFDDWQKKVSEWITILGGSQPEELDEKYLWLEGSNEYMLDLYSQTDAYDDDGKKVQRAPDFYVIDNKDDYQREMAAYMERVDCLLEEMENEDTYIGGWREEISTMGTHKLKDAFLHDRLMPFLTCSQDVEREKMEEVIRKEVTAYFDKLETFDDVQKCALVALCDLQNHLCDLHTIFTKALSNVQFIRLSNRIFYRNCLSDYRDGEAQINKWQNSWPEAKHKTNAQKKKDELKQGLKDCKYGQELAEYIDLDAPNLFTDSSFGRFLFKNRHELKADDVKNIHKVCREINLLNELIGEKSDKSCMNAAPIRQLNEQEQQILDRLKVLIKKGDWQRISAENVVAGLEKALGMGPVFSDTKMVEMSNSLWEQLKKRRGCDADKSLMVSWLNIVGYCVKKGYLSGGSPALCKQFFPRSHADDYKAIDKGRTAEVKSFRAILPLLDACLK